MNKFVLPSGKSITVNRHVSRQQNELRGQSDNKLTPIAQIMKKQYDANIFVNCIPLTTSDDEILKVFGAFGSITQYKIWSKEQTNFKRANLNYSKTEEAQKAIQNLNEERPFGGPKAIKVDFWISKEEQTKEELQQKNDEFAKVLY